MEASASAGAGTPEAYAAEHGFTLDELAARLALGPGEVAYMTGSLLEGLGDGSSDLDVYVLSPAAELERRRPSFVVEESGQQRAQGFGMFYVSIGTAELDIECHPIEKLHELLASLEAYRPADRDAAQASYNFLGRFERNEAHELLHRLFIGRPIGSREAFDQLRARFPTEKFLLWNVTRHMIYAEANQRGIKRELGRGDVESAYLLLCELYDALADALLFASGVSLDRWKWRVKKLRQLPPGRLARAYFEVQIPTGAGPLADFVRRYFELSFALADEIRELVGEDRCVMRKHRKPA